MSTQNNNCSKSTLLQNLKQDFAKFRKKNKDYRVIPDYLRKAVVEALEKDIERADIRVACGINYSQMAAWKEQFNSTKSPKPSTIVPSEVKDSKPSTIVPSEVNILQVVDPPKPKPASERIWFQLQIAGFEIRIQKNNR